MQNTENRTPAADPLESASPLTDQDIATVRVDRRSFLSRAVAAGSIVAGAALNVACPSGGGEGSSASDSDAQQTDSDAAGASDADAAPASDSDAGVPIPPPRPR